MVVDTHKNNCNALDQMILSVQQRLGNKMDFHWNYPFFLVRCNNCFLQAEDDQPPVDLSALFAHIQEKKVETRGRPRKNKVRG